jgi:hypothetical protein
MAQSAQEGADDTVRIGNEVPKEEVKEGDKCGRFGLSPFEITVGNLAAYLLHDKPGLSKKKAIDVAISSVMYARLSV